MSDEYIIIQKPAVFYSDQRVINILLGVMGIDSLKEANLPENRRTQMREVCMYIMDLYTCLHTLDFSRMFNANYRTIQKELSAFKRNISDGNKPKSFKTINQIMYLL